MTLLAQPLDQIRLQYDRGRPENLWKACIFGFVGVEDFQRRNFESIILSTVEQRQGWLQEVRRLVRERFSARSAEVTATGSGQSDRKEFRQSDLD